HPALPFANTGAPSGRSCWTTTTGMPASLAASTARTIWASDSSRGGYWISSGPSKYSCCTSTTINARFCELMWILRIGGTSGNSAVTAILAGRLRYREWQKGTRSMEMGQPVRIAVHVFDGITMFHLAAPLLVFGEVTRLGLADGWQVDTWSTDGGD